MQKEEMIARQHPSIVYKYSRMLFHFLKFESFTENEWNLIPRDSLQPNAMKKHLQNHITQNLSKASHHCRVLNFQKTVLSAVSSFPQLHIFKTK